MKLHAEQLSDLGGAALAAFEMCQEQMRVGHIRPGLQHGAGQPLRLHIIADLEERHGGRERNIRPSGRLGGGALIQLQGLGVPAGLPMAFGLPHQAADDIAGRAVSWLFGHTVFDPPRSTIEPVGGG